MAKSKKRKPLAPDLVTPTIDLSTSGSFVQAADDKLSYWKQILPEIDSFEYVDDDGEVHQLDFSRDSNQLLIDAYHDGTMERLGYLLADKDNGHTMDPERWRANVADMRQAKPDEQPGVYAKIAFGSKKLAKSVINNPDLGVSARIRPGEFVGTSGKKYDRKFVHILGTLDPKATGMSSWTPATDLSNYDSHDVLDLSGNTYTEARTVAKVKRAGKVITPKQFAEMTEAELEAANFTEAEITSLVDGMEEDVLAAFVERNADLISDDTGDDDDDDDDDDDTDDDDTDDDDTDDDADDRETARVPVSADLSNDGKKKRRKTGNPDVDLANSRADEANRASRKALARIADAEWKTYQTEQLAKGVPPHIIDLAKPVLHGTDDFVIDLSNHGGDNNVNASKIVRKLVAGYEGTIDLSDVDLGHGGSEGGDRFADARAELKEWDI